WRTSTSRSRSPTPSSHTWSGHDRAERGPEKTVECRHEGATPSSLHPKGALVTESIVPVPGAGQPDHDGGHGPDFVQSLERGLAVVRAFGPDTPQLTLSEVARATGLTRAAARRFLLTLAELGYVRADGRAFSLRPRILELGFAYLSGLSLPETAQPHMEELSAKVHKSCSVSVLDGHDVVYVARVPTRRIMSVTIAVGTRFPAYATSMGRVLLAGLPPA